MHSKLRLILRWITATPFMPSGIRVGILRATGVSIGSGVHIRSGVWFTRQGQVSLGSNVFVNLACFFDAEGAVTVGDNVSLGDHVRILTATHALGTSEKRAGATLAKPVSIGDGCWIGSSVLILPGVSIGRGTVVAAGAVVTRDCEPDSLYAGSPANFKRRLTN